MGDNKLTKGVLMKPVVSLPIDSERRIGGVIVQITREVKLPLEIKVIHDSRNGSPDEEKLVEFVGVKGLYQLAFFEPLKKEMSVRQIVNESIKQITPPNEEVVMRLAVVECGGLEPYVVLGITKEQLETFKEASHICNPIDITLNQPNNALKFLESLIILNEGPIQGIDDLLSVVLKAGIEIGLRNRRERK